MKKTGLILSTFLTFGLCAQAADKTDKIDIDAKTIGDVGVDGGVSHSSVKDQLSGEICWSYTVSGVAESTYRKNAIAAALKQNRSLKEADLKADMAHYTSHVAPEYLMFWHLYNQYKSNLSLWSRLANKIAADPKSAQSLKAKAVYGVLNPRWPKTDGGNYQPDVGSTGSQALAEAKKFGMMPDVYFTNNSKNGKDISIKTDANEAALERREVDFVGKYLLDPSKIAAYKGADENGINKALYDDMNTYFHDSMNLGLLDKPGQKGTMPLPTDSFKYGNQTLTPITYMSEYLGFNPDDFEAFVTTKRDQKLIFQAVKEALDKDYVVPIGIVLFGDKYVNGKQKDEDTQDLAEANGIFTTDYCPSNKCTNDKGGHEVSVVNYLEKRGEVSAVIIKNSWGRTGARDVNGEPMGAKDAGTGYFVITSDYLSQSATNVDDPWDLILPKEISNKPEFKGHLTPQ